MAITGKIGSPDSKLGNISLGLGAKFAYILTANNTLSFTHGSNAHPFYTLSNTIEFIDGASVISSRMVEAHNDLEITDGAELGYILTAGDDITFSQGANLSRTLTAGNTISFTDGASQTSTSIVVLTGNDLTTYTTVFDPITFTLKQVATGGLRDGASCVKIGHQSAHSILSFSHKANGYVLRADAIACEASNTITFTSGADPFAPKDAHNTIAFTQGATVEVSKNNSGNTVSFSDGASVSLIREINAGNSVTFRQGVTYALIRPCTDQKYNPFGGDLPATLPPAVASDGHLHLLWPATGVATEDVKLKNPNFGNSQRITTSRISRESRGGELIVYSDPIWPKFDSLVVSISFLTASQKTELLTFVKAHLGDEIKLIDWENRTWTGVLIPGDMITEDKHNSFTAAFEFEGERVLS